MPAAGKPSSRRHLRLLLGLLALLLAVVSLRWQAPSTPPVAPRLVEVPREPPPPLPGAIPHLRLPVGTVLRATPDEEATVVRVLDEERLLPVVDRQDRWTQLGLSSPSATGWALSSKQPPAIVWLRSSGTGPRSAEAASPALGDLAHGFLEGGGQEATCGPYRLLTDVRDPRILAACSDLASGLDEAYATRFGIPPIGEPRETLILFTEMSDFQAFAAASGGAGLGYAGHARASEGFLALYVGSRSTDEVLETLVHEITHLLNRRALGGELPRWLSEGLADALGDTANEAGLQPLVGVAGAEGEATRLRLAYASGQAGSVERLLNLGPDQYDTEPVSYDYEQSAFLVRLLLTDRQWSGRFRSFLSDFAVGRRDDPEALRSRLDASWEELDERLQRFVAGEP